MSGFRGLITAAACCRALLALGKLLALGALLAPAALLAQSAADPEPPSGFAPKPALEARRHMIVAAHPLAAEAGLEAMRAGGSAVDAAIAAQAMLNLVEPQSSGFGGGAFALHYEAATGRLTAWDGREAAPLAADPELFFVGDGAERRRLAWREAVNTGLSVGAPGVARMLGAMHARHGRRPWATLFDAAITRAEAGFAVSPRLALSLSSVGRDRLFADEAARAVFFDDAGAPLAAGSAMRNPDLARTLRALARRGPGALHHGPIAAEIVAAARRGPVAGRLSLVDLAVYAPSEREAVCFVHRARYEICGMGPPSSGAVGVAQIIGLMARAPAPADAVARRHLFLEASKLAYADRAAYLADPAFAAQPIAGLLDPGYLEERAALIDPLRASTGRREAGQPPRSRRRAPDPSLVEGGTTHLSVVDQRGDILVMTSSIETSFGAARMAAGLLLNNQLTDFAFQPVKDGAPVANAPGPGKRPRSSMAPTIVFDLASGERRPVLAIGSPGGSRIIEFVAAALVAILDEKASLADAVGAPHLSQRNRDSAAVERRADADGLAASLAALGHSVERADMTSGLHAIWIDAEGRLIGAADPRREGVALGE